MKKSMLMVLMLGALMVPALADDKLKVVATIGQITDVARHVGGDRVIVQGLMGPGVDPHLYRASQRDVGLLADADVIFFNGLHLEAKMAEILERMAHTQKAFPVSNKILVQELREDENFSGNYDPHIWFDVGLWIKVTEYIRDVLTEKDPEGKAIYEENANRYIGELNILDNYIKQQAQSIDPSQRVLVTAHDAFGYYGRRYGFEVLGLQGLSTEAEAGTKDVSRLADIIAERKIKAMFVESSIPERNIKAVQEAVRSRGWDVKIGGELFSDAMGAETSREGTYVGMQEHNINTIVAALK